MIAMHRCCEVCGQENRRGNSCYCSLDCASIVAKARGRVLSIVARQIKTLELEPAKNHACVDCGKPATDYDHRNYLQPVNVVPVCRACNLKRGPASDVRELVAAYLRVDVIELPLAMNKKREERKEWHAQYLRLLRPDVFGEAAKPKKAA